MPITDFSRRAASFLEPLQEIREPDFVLDSNRADGDFYNVHSLSAASPCATASYNVDAVTSTVCETPSMSCDSGIADNVLKAKDLRLNSPQTDGELASLS
jgi:hypothetical protein